MMTPQTSHIKTYLQTGFHSLAVTFQEKKPNAGFQTEVGRNCPAVFVVLREASTQGHSLGIWLAALARRTAPGLGYGLCWNRGPAAVVSAPVFASLRLGRPLDHEPLLTKCLSTTHSDILGVYKTLEPCLLLNPGPETSIHLMSSPITDHLIVIDAPAASYCC